jgi:antitoxin YefM
MNTISLADAKTNLSRVVQDAVTTHLRTQITKNGRPAVVLIAVEDLESLEETIAVLSDPRAMAAVREAEDPNAEWFSLKEVEDIVATRRKRELG